MVSQLALSILLNALLPTTQLAGELAAERVVVRVPFTLESSLMIIETETSVGKLWLALDTGASKCVLQSKLMPSGKETLSLNGRQVPMSRDPLVITLGPFSFKVHPLLLTDKHGFLHVEKGDEHVLSGALGQDFFGFWGTVTFDNLRHEVIFEKGESIDQTTQPVTKLGTILLQPLTGTGCNQRDATGGGEVIVDGTLPVSRHAAGQVALVDARDFEMKTFIGSTGPSPPGIQHDDPHRLLGPRRYYPAHLEERGKQ